MPPTPLEGTGDDDTADAPMEGPEPAPSPKARPARRTASAAKTANRPKKEFTSRPLKDKPTLLSLDLNKLDEDLSEEERNEWNAIYASYRSKSILTGRIMGIDTHSFTVRNRETRQTERRKMLCAVIINYRVKVLIPETEVWYPGQERPPYVLRNMSGAETDYIILDVDREGGVAIGSRRMALAAQRHFFDTIKGGRSIGEKLTCRVLAVGPRRCLVECGGRDMSLSQKDLTYIATPDLRTRYHPGQTLNCVLKEYDRREGQFWVSVKDTVDNPFFGALRRHPIGSRRQAVISGKYGGGVFCTLSDETVCLCHYSTLHSDLDFHVGDTVILAIKQFDYERSLIYGRILSKW
jgi:ribosomal protein S1